MSKQDHALMATAGVFFVASELSLRGLVALPTMRNTAGIDLLVARADGTWQAGVQVKTARRKVTFWSVGRGYRRWCSSSVYYAFVRYLPNEGRFEAFLEASERVATQLDVYVRSEKEKGNAEFTPCWYLPKDPEDVERLRQRWRQFG